MTLTEHAAPIRDTPVDQVDTAAVLSGAEADLDQDAGDRVTPAGRASRRCSTSAQVDGWIPRRPAEPGALEGLARPQAAQPEEGRQARPPRGDALRRRARLHGAAHRDRRRRVAGRCVHHPDRAPNVGESSTRRGTRSTFDTATGPIPTARMKMGKPHDGAAQSNAALAILRAQEAERGKNPYVFPGGRSEPLSNMAMTMLHAQAGGRRSTVQGFRSRRRGRGWPIRASRSSWRRRARPHGRQRRRAGLPASSMLERRRPVMAGVGRLRHRPDADNVVPLRGGAPRDQDRHQRRGVRGDCPDAPARQRGLRGRAQRQRRDARSGSTTGRPTSSPPCADRARATATSSCGWSRWRRDRESPDHRRRALVLHLERHPYLHRAGRLRQS